MACAGFDAMIVSSDGADKVGLARKATGFMTNDEYIAEPVDGRCFGYHPAVEQRSESL